MEEHDKKLLEKCFSFSPNEALLNYGLEIMGIKKEKRKIIFKTHTITGAEIIFYICNNNWRKLHGLPVLRKNTKIRWECISNGTS